MKAHLLTDLGLLPSPHPMNPLGRRAASLPNPVRGFLSLAAGLVLAFSGSASGEPPPAKGKQRSSDRYGDALPRGAIARLGTVRLRHPGSISAVAFSPESKRLATGGGGKDETIRIWETGTRKLLLEWPAPGGLLRALVFSPYGKSLLSAGWFEGPIILWEVATGKELRRFVGPEVVLGVAFSPSGKIVAAVGQDGTVWLWNARTGKKRRHWLAHSNRGEDVVFLPGGKEIASTGFTAVAGDGGGGYGGYGGGAVDVQSVRVWDVATGKELRKLAAWPRAFSRDGKTFAAVEKSGSVVSLWDVATGKRLHRARGPRLRTRFDVGERITAVASARGKLLAAGHSTEGPRLWNLATGKEFPLEGSAQRFEPAAISPNGKWLAAGDGAVLRLWDVASGKELRRAMGHTRPVYFATLCPDGKTLVSAGLRTLRVWDLASARELRRFSASTGRGEIYHGRDEVLQVYLSPDGKFLAQVFHDMEENAVVYIWDTTTGRRLRRYTAGYRNYHTVTFSPDGKMLAAGRINLGLWDATTGKHLRRFQGEDPFADCAVFSPNGKILAAGGGSGFLGLWDVATGKQLRGLGEDPYVDHLAFSPDGKLLASGHEEYPVVLWDVVTGKKLRQIGGRQFNPRGLRGFSPDGRLLVLTGPENTLYLHQVATGREIRQVAGPRRFYWRGGSSLGGPKNHLMDVAFSPDGRTLASEDKDGAIRLWEVASGQERARFAGHEGGIPSPNRRPSGGRRSRRRFDNDKDGVRSLVFSANGRALVSGGSDTTAMVWDVTGGAGKPGTLTARELASLWQALAGDAVPAHHAVWTLASAPAQSVPFLRDRLQPAPRAEPERVRRLIADLDHRRFAVRTRAAQALAELGAGTEPALRKALAAAPSVEARQRLTQVLAKVQRAVLPPGPLRAVRAVEALEHIGTSQASRVLKTLAGGAPEAYLTQEAAAALRRLAKLPPVPVPLLELPAQEVDNAEEKAILALDQELHAVIGRSDDLGGHVVKVVIHRYKKLSDAALAHLKHFKKLRTLEIEGADMKPSGLACLRGLTELRSLRLRAESVGDAALAHLKGLTSLEMLDLEETAVTDTGLAHLKGLVQLRELNLRETKVTGAGLVHLKGLKKLEQLRLDGTQVDDAGLAHLKGLTRIRRLDLARTRVRGPGLAHLADMKDLTRLDLHSTKVTDRGLKYLPAARQLRWVHVGDTAARPQGLRRCPGGKVTLEVDGQSARLYDAATAIGFDLRHTMDRPGSKITCWAFSPDGKLLATGAGYTTKEGKGESLGQLRIWEVSTGRRIKTPFDHTLGRILGVAFHKDSKTVIFRAEGLKVDGA
jgi:WD40 repeat protein